MAVPRTEPDELVKRLDDVVLVDVRNDEDYASSTRKLPGAVRIPVEYVDERAEDLDPNREVVTYCT